MGKKGRKKSPISSMDTSISTATAPLVCPHILKGVNFNTFSTNIASSPSIACQDCSKGKRKGKCKVANNNIWVCLNCAHFTCGGLGLPTSPHCHALSHATQTRHPLFACFRKPHLFWCFHCSMPIQLHIFQDTHHITHLLSNALNFFKQQSSLPNPQNVHIAHATFTSQTHSKTLITTTHSYGQRRYVVRGMLNLGNTCFFNSIMQNLLAIDKLRHNFQNLDAPVGGPLLSSFKKLFIETNQPSGLQNIINPRSFFGCVCSKSPQFRGYQQHDSHEFLRCLLDGLSTEELAARKHNGSTKEDGTQSSNTLVDALFGGQISSTVCCIACGHFSTVYEPFLDLSLPVPTKKPPPSKAEQVSRTKKTKLPRKKGGRSRAKGRKDVDPLPAQSNTSSVVGEMLDSSGDSTVQGSEDISNTADKDDLSPPKLVVVVESHNTQQVLDNAMKNMFTSSDDITWLDFVEDGNMADESDFISQEDTLEVHDTENTNECLKEAHQNLRPDSSSANGWKDEVPLQVQGSEMLLLPYKEVDDTDSPVSVESCLAHFVKPELLSDDNAWYCENCSKLIQRQKMKTNKVAKNVSNGNELSRNTNDRDDGALEMKDKHIEELQSSGSHKAWDEESCKCPAADSSSTLHMSDNVRKSDTQMLGEYSNDSNERSEDEANFKSVKVKRDATKRVLIYKAPPILTIHLNRFSQDARGRLSKLNGHVSFREIIDLRPYMDPRCRNEEKYEYHLVGVVEHLGSMGGGHYVAYVRGAQNESECSSWYHASDSYVREASLNEVLRCQAYILFYQRV